MNQTINAPINADKTATIIQLFDPEEAPAAPPIAAAIAVIKSLLFFSSMIIIIFRHIKMFLSKIF